MLEPLLRQILTHEGIEGLVLSDSDGEPVYTLGHAEVEKLQLLGAYQGILMGAIARCLEGDDRTAITVCDTGAILTRHLKDGYFISVILSPGIHFARVLFHLGKLYSLLIKEF